VIEVPMTHSQTDYEIILISRYVTVGDLKKRIKKFKGSSDFSLWKAMKFSFPFDKSYKKYQLMLEKKEENFHNYTLNDDEILMSKAGFSEEYTLIIYHLDMDPIKTSFDQANVSTDECEIKQ
jgi:hypothetical protein